MTFTAYKLEKKGRKTYTYFQIYAFMCVYCGCVLNFAVASIQRLPAVSVMTDINFPMKGRKGMVDWARNSEDKVVIPKGLFVSQSAGTCQAVLFAQGMKRFRLSPP